MTASDAATAAVAAKTKITVKASAEKVKIGTTVKYTGKLTKRTAKGYKPYAKQQVRLLLLHDGRPVLATVRTSASGKYTIKLKTEEWMVGPGGVLLTVHFDGNARSESAWTGWFPLVVTPK